MMSTNRRILVFAFLVLAGTVAVNTLFHLHAFRRSCLDGLLVRCHSAAGGLKAFIETNLQCGLPLSALPEVDGFCRQIVGNDPDLAYCLVENERGQAIFSNLPTLDLRAAGSSATAVSAHTTRVDLPGVGRVFNFSLPLYGGDKGLAGRVHIGFSEDVLQKHTAGLLGQSLTVLGCALLAVFTLVALFVRRDLLRPIRSLSGMAREIAAGNFRVGLPPMPSREFAELGTALREMAVALERRDESAAKSYRTLEQTNELLQQAYEQQEKTSNELARSQKMHRALFENASDAIVISDHEERILLFNRQAEAFFGISRDQAIGSKLSEFAAKIRGNVRAQRLFYAELLAKGRMEGEIRCMRAKDEPVVGWSSASVVHERNGKFWVQIIIRDITREARLKENLEQSARELQRLNQMKDSFLGLASHELKTPLTVIVGYSDLLLGETAVLANASTYSMVRHVADAAERLTDIVQDMVDVSMLDRCRLPMDIRPLDINRLLEQAADAADPFLEQRKQQITLELQPQLPPVECDAGRLKQAFGNLLGNAIKFTPDGGTITVHSRLSAPADDGEANVEVLIADTGIGIADGDREYIFQKFYEGGEIEEHFTAKAAFKGKGTGLGLTIAKGIVDMHGGRIWVESPGYDPQRCPGSIFHVLLPVRSPAGAGRAAGLSCG